jgi:hypothetical protein
MDIQFEIFVVVKGNSSRQENVLVTTVFNDAFSRFILEKKATWIEVWKEGKRTSKFLTLDDLISAGRVTRYNYDNP